MAAAQAIEIATTTHGYTRLLQRGQAFEVQTLRIRGEHKIGPITYWHTIATLWDRAKAVALYEAYA